MGYAMNIRVPLKKLPKLHLVALLAATIWAVGCSRKNSVTGVNTRSSAKPLDKNTPETAALENAKNYFKSMGPDLENKILKAVAGLSGGPSGNQAATALWCWICSAINRVRWWANRPTWNGAGNC